MRSLTRISAEKPTITPTRKSSSSRDVLLTLLPEDIAGWGRSIQLRGIELPSAVKEELLMIVAEARREANIVQ